MMNAPVSVFRGMGRNLQTATLPVRIQQTQAGMTSAATVVERGTAVVCTITAPDTKFVIGSVNVNPADPDFVSRLSKVASLYQKFNPALLTFRYLPAKGSSTDGQLYVTFIPNPQAPSPTNMDELTTYGGIVQGTITTPLSYPIQPTSMNTAFKSQLTDVAIEPGSDQPINSIGRLFYGIDGQTNSSPVTFGTLYVDYSMTFSDPKLSYSDQVNSVASLDTLAIGTNLLSRLEIDAGIRAWVPDMEDDESPCRRRGRAPSHMLMYAEWAGETRPSLTLMSGDSLGSLEEKLPFVNLNSDGVLVKSYSFPAGAQYATLTSDVALTAIRVYIAPGLGDL